MICDNISVSKEGHLLFAGQDTVELAARYGTPVYLMDEDKIRENCRKYKKAFSKSFGSSGSVLYASKANCFKRIYEIMSEEEMGIVVVSSGEIYTAIYLRLDDTADLNCYSDAYDDRVAEMARQPAASAPMQVDMALCSLSTAMNSVSTSPLSTYVEKYWGISVDGVMG